MIAVLILLILQLSICFAGTNYTNRNPEEFLPTGLIGMTGIIYLFGLLSLLDVGILVAVIASLLFVGFSFVCKKPKIEKVSIRKLLTPAICIYIVVILLFVWSSYGRKVYAWDECSHWALAVKSMVYHNQLYFIPEANIKFPSYPPGSSIFHYLGQVLNKVTTGETYCEWLLFATFNMLSASFAIPTLSRIQKDRKILPFALAIILMVLPMCFYDEMYGILQIETMLAMAVFYVLYLFAFDNHCRISVVFKCLGIGILVLLKDSGLYFAIMIPALFFIFDWVSKKKVFFEEKGYLPYLGYAGVAAITKWSWSNALTRNQTNIIWSDPVDLKVFLNVALGKETGYRRTVFLNFWKELLNPQIGIGPISISFLFMFLALLGVSVVLMLLRNKQRKDKGNFYLLIPAFVTAFYVFGLLFVYMFKFERNEAMSLNSYPRYTKVAYVTWTLFLVLNGFDYIQGLKKKIDWITIPIACAVFGVGMMKSNLLPLLTREDAAYSISKQEEYISCKEMIEKYVSTDERVYILTQEHDGFEYHMLYYLLYPIHPNEDGFSIGKLMVSDEFEEDVWTKQIPWDEWQKELMDDYSYVYVYSSNESLEQDYAPLFPQGVQEKMLYRVNKDTGELLPVV